MSVSWLIGAFLLAATEPPETPLDEAPFVTLAGQRGELERVDGAPILAFGLVVDNRLPVSLGAVFVGILFAESPEPLDTADPGAAYQRGASGDELGVRMQWVEVRVPPEATAPISLRLPMAVDEPKPVLFRTHLLSYRLERPTAPLLLEMLNTDRAADEAAACDTLGLIGGGDRAREARRRWGKETELVDQLASVVEPGRSSPPAQSDLLQMAFAVRALGVLGGPRAHSALVKALAHSKSGVWDEAFQLLRVARLRGAVLETPVAFVVPEAAATMEDLVAAALEQEAGSAKPNGSGSDGGEPGSSSPRHPEPSVAQPNNRVGDPSPAPLPVLPAPKAVTPPQTKVSKGVLVGAGVLLLTGALYFFLSRRRGRR